MGVIGKFLESGVADEEGGVEVTGGVDGRKELTGCGDCICCC